MKGGDRSTPTNRYSSALERKFIELFLSEERYVGFIKKDLFSVSLASYNRIGN